MYEGSELAMWLPGGGGGSLRVGTPFTEHRAGQCSLSGKQGGGDREGRRELDRTGFVGQRTGLSTDGLLEGSEQRGTCCVIRFEGVLLCDAPSENSRRA